MKKVVCALVALCAMLLVCSCAGALCPDHQFQYESIGYDKHKATCTVCGDTWEAYHDWSVYIDLGDMHVNGCKYCGYQAEPDRHIYYCNEDPTICDRCGATGLSSDKIDIKHSTQYVSIGDKHSYGCYYCDWIDPDWSEGHYTYCNEDLTVCRFCRATGLSGDNIRIIHFAGPYENIGTQHQATCKNCGVYKFEAYDHYGSCQDKDFCEGCNTNRVSIREDKLSHDYQLVDLGKQHVWVCSYCLEYEEEPENHTVMCDEPDYCTGCGRTVSEVEEDCIYHWTSYTTYERTTTEHTAICSSCDKHWEPIKHFRTCTENGICAECRMSSYNGVVISRTVHYAKEGTITYTAEGHSFDCLDCGQRVKNQSHFYWYSDECDECGYLYGSLPPSPVLTGDPTGDGEVDIFDALAVLQFAVGWDSDINQDAGDVNDDGACDIFDALLILQYSVGWDVELK